MPVGTRAMVVSHLAHLLQHPATAHHLHLTPLEAAVADHQVVEVGVGVAVAVAIPAWAELLASRPDGHLQLHRSC